MRRTTSSCGRGEPDQGGRGADLLQVGDQRLVDLAPWLGDGEDGLEASLRLLDEAAPLVGRPRPGVGKDRGEDLVGLVRHLPASTIEGVEQVVGFDVGREAGVEVARPVVGVAGQERLDVAVRVSAVEPTGVGGDEEASGREADDGRLGHAERRRHLGGRQQVERTRTDGRHAGKYFDAGQPDPYLPWEDGER